eukprot:8264506-Pyramimonas_sp.AAC.1
MAHFDDMIGACMDRMLQARTWLTAPTDMTTVRIELNRFAKRMQFEEWPADLAVVGGGQWIRERLAAGCARPPACPRWKEGLDIL